MIEVKRFQIPIAVRRNRSVAELMGGQVIPPGRVPNGNLEPRDQQRPADRRGERSGQQAVVTARVGVADRPRGKSADAVGDEPLTLDGSFEYAALVTSKMELGYRVAPRIAFTFEGLGKRGVARP